MAELKKRLERFMAFDVTTMPCPVCAEVLETVRADFETKAYGDKVLVAKLNFALALTKCDGEHEPTPVASERAVRSRDAGRQVKVRCVHKDLVPVEGEEDKKTYVRCDVVIEGSAAQLAECKSLCEAHIKK